MKFKYLKLSLLMVAISAAPFAMNAQADVEGAVKDLSEYLNPAGPQRTAEETIAKFDAALAALAEYPEYQELYVGLSEMKNLFIQASIAQAKGVLDRVAGQLETLHESLSPETKQMVTSRFEQIKNLSMMQKGKFLGRLGLTIKLFGK